MRKVKQLINERKLYVRIKEASKQFGRRFAYCVEDDVFCETDVQYTDYIKKHYICFSNEFDERIFYGLAFEAHLPLSMKISTCEELIM